MKKLILLAGAFLLTMNASFASCAPKFDDADIMEAIESFVQSKLGNSSTKVMAVELVASRAYKTEREMITRMFDPSLCTDMTSRNCRPFNTILYPSAEEVACVNSANSNQDYKVTMSSSSDATCEVMVNVVMTSGFRSFKSKVKNISEVSCK